MKWIIQENTSNRLAKFKRTAGYDPVKDEVYFSAALFGGEDRNFMCMSFDGVDAVFSDKHLYCPVSWLKKEFPGMADDIDHAAESVREFINHQKED